MKPYHVVPRQPKSTQRMDEQPSSQLLKGRDDAPQATDIPAYGPVCPVPWRDHANVILEHGSGGKLSAELIEHVFLPAFQNDLNDPLGDAAVFKVTGNRLAMSTDSYVVDPLFFPGGSIADLAVNGTVNDLAMRGARALYLSAAFILEEGLPMDQLRRIAKEMGAAARQAGISIITGDTKVVERGHGDGCYITTTGIGIIPDGIDIAPTGARPTDTVILSGTIGDHGMAVMRVREGLEFDAEINSDSAPLADLVAAIIAVCPQIHVLRDPTRGGIATSLNEIAAASGCGIEVEESLIPIHPTVQSACEILGLDPMQVANEGKLICIVPSEFSATVLAAMQAERYGTDAAIIGRVVAEHPGMVLAKTLLGTSRVIPMPIGQQLPRIC